MTREMITNVFNKAEREYRITLGRVKYFYNREQFDRIPWDKLNHYDDIMNNAIIAMMNVEFKSDKVKTRVLERMTEIYNALDEKRAKFL